MSLKDFLGDLVNRPEVAIEKMNTQRNKRKTLVLFVATGFLLLVNYFIAHFTAGIPGLYIFAAILGVVGIAVFFFYVLGFAVTSYVFLKITKHENAGALSKSISWCVLIPTFIYQSITFVIYAVLINVKRIEWAGYIYDQLKWLLYIWIIGLCVVAVINNQPKYKIRNTLGILGLFSINLIVWTILHWMLMETIFTGFI